MIFRHQRLLFEGEPVGLEAWGAAPNGRSSLSTLRVGIVRNAVSGSLFSRSSLALWSGGNSRE